MRRREFITLLGGAAVIWPVVGHAQQRVMPVVGVLCAGTAEALERYLAGFREGMRQLGYVEGTNVRFEFRFADGYLDRLPDLANELVRLNPRVIVSTPLPAHLAARKATRRFRHIRRSWRRKYDTVAQYLSDERNRLTAPII